MTKITAFIGTQQKQATYRAVREMEQQLKTYADIEFEYVFLKDYELKHCRGCKLCFNKGEQYCPLKDDRDLLLEKLNEADGVILATPNYAFHVSASMKNLLDRLAYMFHRPQFFGKAFTSVVTQGIYGGNAIVKYLDNMGVNFGFQVSKGCVLQTLEPATAAAKAKNSREIEQCSKRFYKQLMRSAPKTPSLFRLMMFRMSRTHIKSMLNDKYRDYPYYREQGWFESDYYYPVRLGVVKRMAGRMFDGMAARRVKRR